MHWIYHTQQKWQAEEEVAVAQKVFLRAVGEETEEGKMVSDIIEMNVFGMDYYFGLENNPLAEPKYQQIYFEELDKKDYYLEEMEMSEGEQTYMMNRTALYLKKRWFSKMELLEWVKTYLSILGLPCTGFEEEDMMAFYELNPLLQMFSLENAKRFEGKLGKEWWKRNDKK
ncbi:MAG: hypothetical protein ACPGVB_10750 [Chitinophagales bacterium]